MTAKTSDFNGLLFYNPAAHGFNPIASATITGPDNMDEGATETWDLVTWDIPDGDIYWRIVPYGDNMYAGRFDNGLSGTVSVANNRTSLSITVSADETTSSTGQSFDIIFSKTQNGTAFATKYGVGVNDTSQPGPSGTDFFYAGDQNNWFGFGTTLSASTYSDPAPAQTPYTYPNGSLGNTRDFTGGEWMSSINLNVGGAWQTNEITVDFWFYPTTYNVQLMSESDHQDVTSGYHYSLLEIDSNGYVHARFYNGGYPANAIVSQLPVALNHWNHIYFTEYANGAHSFELNSIPTNGNATYTRIKPTLYEYFIVGVADATSLGSGVGRFQGKIGWLTISDYQATSTFTNQRNRFKPAFVGFQSATNGGSNGVHIDSDPYNDNWLSTVPVGATIDAEGYGTFTVAGVDSPSAPGNFSGNWFFSVTPNTSYFAAGTRMTISWTT